MQVIRKEYVLQKQSKTEISTSIKQKKISLLRPSCVWLSPKNDRG